MNKTDKKILKQEIERVKKEIGVGFLLSNDYAADLINSPTPFTFSLLRKIFSYEGSVGKAFEELGVSIKPFENERYAVSFLGRFYLNLRVEEEFLYNRVGFYYQYSGNKAYLYRKLSSPASIGRFLKYSYAQGNIIQNILGYISGFNAVGNDWRVLDLNIGASQMDFDDAIEELKENVNVFISEYKEIYKFAFVEEVYHQYVKDSLGEKFKEEFLFVESGKSNMYKKSVEALDLLANGGIGIEQFIEKFGIRSFNDFEFSEPRWLEQSDKLEDLFDNRVKSTSGDFLHRFGLDPSNTAGLTKKEKIIIENLREILLLKDNMRFYILRRIWVIRQLLLRISEILSLGDMIFFLTFDEIITLKRKNLAPLKRSAKARSQLYDIETKIALPNLISARTNFDLGKISDAKSYISGMAVSPGYAHGELLFINNPLQKVKPGLILVLPTSGPEYAHLYNQAKGVVFQKGGLLSHGAILTREFRVPAIVSSNYEKMKSWEGSDVVLEADKGKVTLNR